MVTLDQLKKELPQTRTPIQLCVHEELTNYFRLLDGQTPQNLYRLVIDQAEKVLLTTVLNECNGNQSKASKYLGLSRGTLRSKMKEYECTDEIHR